MKLRVVQNCDVARERVNPPVLFSSRNAALDFQLLVFGMDRTKVGDVHSHSTKLNKFHSLIVCMTCVVLCP